MAPLSGWGVQLLPISRLLSPSTGPGTPVSKMAGPCPCQNQGPSASTASTLPIPGWLNIGPLHFLLRFEV